MDRNPQPVSFRFTPEVVDMLRILAREDGRTAKSYLEMVIRDRWKRRERARGLRGKQPAPEGLAVQAAEDATP